MVNWKVVAVVVSFTLAAIVPKLQAGKTPSCQDPGVCGKFISNICNKVMQNV